MEKKLSPNMFISDDSLVEEFSSVTISPAKMEELKLFAGDTVLLKGKKRKETVAVVNPDESASDNKVRITKVMRSNLSYLHTYTNRLIFVIHSHTHFFSFHLALEFDWVIQCRLPHYQTSNSPRQCKYYHSRTL